MSYNESVLKELLDLIPQTGKLEWIGIRPGKKQALAELKSVRIEQGSTCFTNASRSRLEVTLCEAKWTPNTSMIY